MRREREREREKYTVPRAPDTQEKEILNNNSGNIYVVIQYEQA